MCKMIARTCIILSIVPAMWLAGCADASRSAPGRNSSSDAEQKISRGVTDDSVVRDDLAKATTPATTQAAPTPATSPEQSADNSAVRVALADFDELTRRIAAFKKRVVVVDAWSTSCLPCMKEFPHLVELARRWPEDVVCISVNLDYAGLPGTTPADCLPPVTKFLQSKAADPANLVNLVSTVVDEQMYAKFEIESIPSVFVYDRAGMLAGKLTVDTAGENGLTYAEDVVPLVEKLIEQ